MIKGISIGLSFFVAAFMAAGLANDVQDIIASEQHGTPIPQCKLVSVLRPACD